MGSACQCRACGLHNAWAEWLLLTASTIGLHTPADCDKDGSSMPQGTRTSPSVAAARWSAAHELHSDSCLEPSMSSLFRTGLLGDGSSGCRDFTDGLHTQPFCRDGGASRPKGPSKSPDAADVCRSAVWPHCLGKAGPTPGGLLAAYRTGLQCLPGWRCVADCFECLSALSRNFNYLNACRVGEASNPGPGPKAPAGLQQFIQQAVQKAIQEAIANLDLSSLVGNVVAATPAPTLPPAGSRAHRRKKAKLKKAAATLARAAGSQGQPRHPTPLSASPTETADAKARGKGNNAKSRPAKARGNSEETQDPNAGGKGKGTGKGQHDAGPQRAEADWTTVQRRRQGKPETPWTLCSEDWDATVCAYQGVAEALQNIPAGGSFRAVVLCNSKDQTDTIAGLLRNSGTQHAVRLVVVADKASEGERCPGRVGTQRAFRHVHFAKVFTAGLQVPGPAVKGTALKPVAEAPTMVLYVRFHKQFLPRAKWDEALRAPQAAFHTWVATHGLRVRDSFSWSKERQSQEVTSVFGLARVDVSDAQAIVALSGQGLFVDPSKRSGFPEFTTEWVDKLPREQPLDYLARAGALGAQFGLVCGTRSLGRRTARDPSKPTARTWMLENTPHSWTPAQAERAVSTIFTEVKMLRQRRHRSGCTFSFRGSHTTTHDMIALPLEAENGSEGITLWCRWAPPARTLQRQAIHTSGSWSLVRPADPFAATETTVQAAPECGADPLDQADADMSTEDKAQVLSEDKAKVGEKQKNPATATPPAKRRQTEQRAIPPGLVIKHIPTEGNCLFEAFAEGLAATAGKEKPLHHLLVRAELIQHYMKHSTTYSELWDHELPDGSHGSSFESYVEAMARPKVWGGILELRALARMYNVRITVVPRATSEQVFTIKPAQKQRLVVLLFSGDHFDTLLPEDGKAFPQQIKDVVTEPPIIPMRGGGGSSRCTVWTDAASGVTAVGARPIVSQCVPDAALNVGPKPPSCKRKAPASSSAAPSAFASGSRRSSCKRRAPASRITRWTDAPAPREDAAASQVEAELEALVQECAAKPRRKTGRPQRCQWVQGGFARCRLCPFRFATEDPAVAQQTLSQHFKRHHRGSTPTGGPSMSQQLPSLVTELSPDQDCVWKCKFCGCGISTEAARSAGAPRIARDKQLHKRQAHPTLTWKQWRASDYSERALASTTTRYQTTVNKRPPLPGFCTFRWPRPAGAKTPQLVKFTFSWACLACHAPYISLQKAKTHLKVCPSVRGRSRAAERLEKLQKLRAVYARKAPQGPRRTAELALFDAAAKIFERAASPLP